MTLEFQEKFNSEKIFMKKDKADVSSSNNKSSTIKDKSRNNDISIIVIDKIVKVYLPHIIDLFSTPKGVLPKSLENVPLLSPSINYLTYFVQVVQHLFLTIIFDWTAIITHPVNFLLTFVVFPLSAVMLFFLEIILKFISCLNLDSNKDETLLKSWSKLIPLSELMNNLHSGMKSLDQFSLSDEIQSHQGFNLDRAQFLLFLSSIMYERNEKQVIEAHHMLSEMKKDIDSANNDDLQEIERLLKESEKRICDQVREFNLQFTSLSELNTLGGPYVGMFWSEESNFITIACKGTTPTNFSEWLTNASFQRMDARGFLFGEVHQGFYSQLFPMNEYDSARLDRICPATRIIEAVRRKGEEIRTRKMKNNNTTHENTPLVNIYVTGHSLGGALANLLYGRLIKFPQCLGEHCTLRDGTTFASPSIGDSDFAAEFSSLCNRSIEEYKTLWRIVCDNDIVPRVPPGHHHPKLRRYTQKIHIMNYFHVGDEVRFYQDGSRPSSMRDIFSDNKEYLLLEDDLEWDEWKSLFGFYDPFDHKKHQKKLPFDPKYDGKLIPIESFLLSPIRNHMSHRYLVALEKSRKFFDANKVVKAGENMV
ncbi:Alpha/Beta hydrolase protein [Glomus cerebriforme]|uniref:Alpha/Beta hydrolase protein n=1 Tax=Glomus cerebriforme TaxID=658196 RepID=A0A397SQJ3_9GLOM|nr:Alpha/Beta hydrolase protein [Glomus cerebriforme]